MINFHSKETTTALITLIIIYIIYVIRIQFTYFLDLNLFDTEPFETYVYNKLADAHLFKDDIVADFISAKKTPIMYDLVHKAWVYNGLELHNLHKLMGPILWISFLIFMALIGHSIYGITGSFFVLFFTILHSNIFITRITNAEIHSFAFPLLALYILAMLNKRFYTMGAIVLASSLFYPAITISTGIAYAFHTCWHNRQLLRNKIHTQNTKQILYLAVIGISSLAICAPILFFKNNLDTPFDVGQIYPPGEGEGLYPETVAQSEFYFLMHNKPYSPLLNHYGLSMQHLHLIAPYTGNMMTHIAKDGALTIFTIASAIFFIISFVFCYFGMMFIKQHKPTAFITMTVFLCAMLTTSVLSIIIAPLAYYRFIYYPFTIIIPILMALGVLHLSNKKMQKALSISLCCIPLFNTTSVYAFYNHQTTKDHIEVIDYLKKQPQDASFTSCPKQAIAFSYFTKKSNLVNNEVYAHNYYTKFTPLMRERMLATMNAFYSDTPKDAMALQQKWGTDYLVVCKFYFTEAHNTPAYVNFSPIKERITELIQNNKGRYWVKSEPDSAIINNDTFIVIDLNRLQAE